MVGPSEGDEGMLVELAFRPSEDFEGSGRAASGSRAYRTSNSKRWGDWITIGEWLAD